MKEYILSLCFAMIFCVAVKILVPGKKYEGIMKILCGIFLIATVMNPLGRIFSVGELSLNTNRYFTGDSEFEFRINDATDRFTRVLTSGDASLMEDTLTRLTGCNVTVSVRDATLCVGGVPHEKRDLVKNYVQSHGAEVVFED